MKQVFKKNEIVDLEFNEGQHLGFTINVGEESDCKNWIEIYNEDAEECEEVANLVASAPELLLRLKQFLSLSEDAPIMYRKEVKDLCQKAIDKAEQKQIK